MSRNIDRTEHRNEHEVLQNFVASTLVSGTMLSRCYLGSLVKAKLTLGLGLMLLPLGLD